mmetsp:Transcript_6332/g.18195  ORF Transcript_6332/g.18195 Transcript_6332/m.18195 type:complete len:638 (+) Transcript_6332:204-2117(+)
MDNVISLGLTLGKRMVVAGCVPQGDRNAKALEGISVIGVSQIDRVVEAVSETLKGNRVQMLKKKSLPRLDLPKVRKNRHVEIIPLSTGCLGACTYCKTVHARGQLGSYDPAALVSRAQQAVNDPMIREIWLSSEDTGAYGRDIGTDLPTLLRSIIAVLPADKSTMLRVGMTNPPFILEHLDAIAACLNDPRVFSYLHIPLQSASNSVLGRMNREYTVEEFRRTADTLLALVPRMELATDIIVGFPGETEDEWRETVELVQHYKFPHCHISQMYVRPGTPAAKMKKVAGQMVKARSRELTKVVDGFTHCYDGLVGTTQHVTIVDTAADGHHLVGHTNTYAQVLVPPQEGLMGCTAEVLITASGRWSVRGQLLRVLCRPPLPPLLPVTAAPAAAAAAHSGASPPAVGHADLSPAGRPADTHQPDGLLSPAGSNATNQSAQTINWSGTAGEAAAPDLWQNSTDSAGTIHSAECLAPAPSHSDQCCTDGGTQAAASCSASSCTAETCCQEQAAMLQSTPQPQRVPHKGKASDPLVNTQASDPLVYTQPIAANLQPVASQHTSSHPAAFQPASSQPAAGSPTQPVVGHVKSGGAVESASAAVPGNAAQWQLADQLLAVGVILGLAGVLLSGLLTLASSLQAS